jgi:hypothetical protein
MGQPAGHNRGPRVPVEPLLDWVAMKPRHLPDNECRILRYSGSVGHIDLFIADRIFCMCGHPEMLSLLYGDAEVPA